MLQCCLGANTNIKDSRWACATVPTCFKKKWATSSQISNLFEPASTTFSSSPKVTGILTLTRLDEVFQHLGDAGLKVNARKSFFGRAELECLGFWITRDGIQPLPKKAEAIKNIATPKNKKDVRSFIGMCNFCRDMWQRRAEILAPLASLTSKNAKWEWTDVHQKAFDDAKCVIGREVMLAFPDFNKTFDIHTDASDTQLGAMLSQDGKPVAFCSRKLSGTQKCHTMTERELLAIAETSKEHRNILLGHKICICADHKNLTCKNFNADRVSRWRLLVEECGPELICLPGETNVVADALSRSPVTMRQTWVHKLNSKTSQRANARSSLCVHAMPNGLGLTKMTIFRSIRRSLCLVKPFQMHNRKTAICCKKH